MKKKLLRQPFDFWVGIVFLVLSIFAFVIDASQGGDARMARQRMYRSIWTRSGIYVNIWSAALGFLSILLILRSIRWPWLKLKPSDPVETGASLAAAGTDVVPEKEEVLKPKYNVIIVISSVALVVYCFVLPIIHFIPATILLCLIFFMTYRIKERHIDWKHDKKAVGIAAALGLVYSTIIVVVLQFVFSTFLNVRLP
jgi:hypothetical protein